MKTIKILATLVIMCALTSCYSKGSSQSFNSKGANMHATDTSAGSGYIDACKAVLQTPYMEPGLYVCQWPDSYPGSDEPGAAYKEGQAAAEDADCHEDSETN